MAPTRRGTEEARPVRERLDQRWAAPVLLAASWSATLERKLGVLPSARRDRDIRYNERVAHAPGVESLERGAYFRDHDDKPVLGPARCPHKSRTRSAASVVMIGRMADRHLRQRSFYLETAVPLTMALHERPAQGAITGLLAGVEVQRLAHGRLPAAVPQVLAARTTKVVPGGGWWARASRRSTAQQVDVVVEEWLPGAPVQVGTPDMEHELLEIVSSLWRLEETRAVALTTEEVSRIRERFTGLVDKGQQDGLWPEGIDPVEVGRRADRLLSDQPHVTIGLSHGDPGVGNVLRTGDGGLVLVDWEDAGRRVLSHDVLKVLSSAAVAPQRWPGMHPVVPASGADRALPSDQQLAVALLQFLAGWRSRTRRARDRRSMGAHQRRMHRMLTALDGLLG